MGLASPIAVVVRSILVATHAQVAGYVVWQVNVSGHLPTAFVAVTERQLGGDNHHFSSSGISSPVLGRIDVSTNL